MNDWMKEDVVRAGDNVLLFMDERRRWLIRVSEGKKFHTHRGIIDCDRLLGKKYGRAITSSLGHSFFVLRPSIYDMILSTGRHTQIMYPKDIGYLLLKLGIQTGKVVVEAGTGSGGLTLALANAVKPNGHVYSYEIRREFAEAAKQNLVRFGLSDYVTINQADVTMGVLESGVDAVFIDLAEPWKAMKHAHSALRGGCGIASFSPTINQVERAVEELKRTGFIGIETIEIFSRDLRVEAGKTRPKTTMIGHTGYLTTAQKIYLE